VTMSTPHEKNNAHADTRLSIVIPVRNEADSVRPLAVEVNRACAGLSCSWECIWVNDGSTDNSAEVIASLSMDGTAHRLVDLDGNFGQSAALAAGFAAARGDLVATLDGDGQNDPSDLPKMFAVLEAGGWDLVNGVRSKRQDSWVRKASSRIANGFRNRLNGESVTDVGCAIRVFKRECVMRIPVFKGMHRFLPTLIKLQGFKVTEVPVNHRPRERGQTKYGINNRLWVGIADTLAVVWMKRRLVWPCVKKRP
jgi:dolichol-phosphate mannosyltransferase